MKTNVKKIKEYKKVEVDLTHICNVIITMIDGHLISLFAAWNSFVFYYKMKDGYYQYLAKFHGSNRRKDVVNQSLKAYNIATTTTYWTRPN